MCSSSLDGPILKFYLQPHYSLQLIKLGIVLKFICTCIFYGVTFFSELHCINECLDLVATSYCLKRGHKLGTNLVSTHFVILALWVLSQQMLFFMSTSLSDNTMVPCLLFLISCNFHIKTN
jgi:hypothetical protein